MSTEPISLDDAGSHRILGECQRCNDVGVFGVLATLLASPPNTYASDGSIAALFQTCKKCGEDLRIRWHYSTETLLSIANKKFHDDKEIKLRKQYQIIEADLRKEGLEYKAILANPVYNDAFSLWQAHRNSCPQCGSSELERINYSMMWGEADIVCARCNAYVRSWDSG